MTMFKRIAKGVIVAAAVSGGAVAAVAPATASAAPAAAPAVATVALAGSPSAIPEMHLSGGAVSMMGIQPTFQGGWDRDHFWVKVTKGEILGGMTTGVCRYFTGPAGWFICPPISQAARQLIDRNPRAGGVWIEIWLNGRAPRLGTW
jgi:hypothetical protein